jgi:hypothetical protein
VNVTAWQQLVAVNGTAAGDLPAVAGPPQSGLIPRALAHTKPPVSAPAFMPVDGKLTIGRVSFENFAASDVQSQVAIRGPVFDLNPLAFNLFGGRYQGQVKVDRAESQPVIAVGGGFNGVDVNQFLSAVSPQKNIVFGRASGTLNLRARGPQLDVKTLTGPGRLVVTDGRISSFDLARQVEIIGKLTGLSTGGAGTEFRSLSTDYRFDNGQVFTNNVRLEMTQMQVTGDGVLQLGEPVMCDYSLLAQLSAALSRTAAPGGGAVEAASFFLDRSRLGVPLKMSGPITQPSFKLDPEGLSRRVTERIVRSPEEAVKGILDLFKGKPKPEEKKKKP